MFNLSCFRDVIELWPSRQAMADDLGMRGPMASRAVSKWHQRKNIPPEWWDDILATGVAKSSGLTAGMLVKLAARSAVSREPAEARP